MTAQQKKLIADIINQMVENCLGSTLYRHMIENGIKFKWNYNPSFSGQAGFNPNTNEMTVKDPSSVALLNIMEEFFHAYQNRNISGGIGQFKGKAGEINIEFEAKVIRDLMQTIEGVPGMRALIGQEYSAWLQDLSSNGAGYPSSMDPAMLSQYYRFMEEFARSGGYSGQIKPGLDPTSMFDWQKESRCLTNF